MSTKSARNGSKNYRWTWCSLTSASPPLTKIIYFFLALYKLTWDEASSFPFSLEGARKRFLFYNQSFFVISPIKSIPFLKFSRDHLRSTLGITCGRGSFAVHFGDHLWSRYHLRLGIICGTVQHSRLKYVDGTTDLEVIPRNSSIACWILLLEIFNNYSSSPNGLLTQRPSGREE